MNLKKVIHIFFYLSYFIVGRKITALRMEVEVSVSYQYAVIGGDARQSYLASILAKNHKVIVFGVTPMPEEIDVGQSFEDTIRSAKCILAPTPLTKDRETINCDAEIKEKYYLSTLFQTMTVNQQLYAGSIPREKALLARRLQIRLIDYMNIEEIAWKNAVATAEGTLAEAIRYYPNNIQGSKCLILGFGRCGMIVAKLFREVGAKVTVCVRRREVICRGECFGFDMKFLEVLKNPEQLDLDICTNSNINNISDSKMIGVSSRYSTWNDSNSSSILNKLNLSDIDIIINTIPSSILNENVLTHLSKECLVLDIAGQGGGTDFEKAKELGIEAHLCSGLPGKYSPKASARILAEFIENTKDTEIE